MGFECRQVQGRQVLVAVLDNERLVAGEKLPPASLPSYVARWTGRYRPRLLDGETVALSTVDEVRVFPSEGRLWVEYKLHRAFGGGAQVALLQPISETAARAVGPLADVGPMVQIEDRNGESPRVRFSGWTFDRVGD